MNAQTISKKTLTPLSRVVIALCGLLLAAVLFVPLWQIQMDAPQYPEGLVLKMYPHKLAGDVEIINGLNHYIGMKKLHADDFIEFTVLPYIIGFFALFTFVVAAQRKRIWLTILTSAFILFGIISMIDFWKWEYDYGHNLDPAAAIQVPGMSYQPPLIGFKQLLNFGVYSIPDLGGIFFILVAVLLLIITLREYKLKKKKEMTNVKKLMTAATVFFMMGLASCSTGPQPIKLGSDACTFCKMTISDKNFGAEIMTKKGKAYKFDDTHCLVAFMHENTVEAKDIQETYLVNFVKPHNFIESSKVLLLKSEDLHSPMGGNVAGFDDKNKLDEVADKVKGEIITWEALQNEH